MFEKNERLERLRKKMESGEPVIGCFVLFSDPSISEIVGLAGCDFVWIDSEHSMMDRTQIKNHIVYAQSTGACAFVRVPGVEPNQVKCVLDYGPDAIIFPNITSKEMAEAAVASTVFPTQGGVRGVGPTRIIDYGIKSEPEYLNKGQEYIWKIFQIESLEGVENMEEIAKVPGFHSLFVGPADLGISMRANKYSEDEIGTKLEEVQSKCAKLAKENGKYSGSCASLTKESCEKLLSRGMNWMTVGQDLRLISCTLADGVRRIHEQ